MPRQHPVRAIVTRPQAQAGPWLQALRAAGVEALALPLIEIAPLPDPALLDAAWATLDRHALVFFVSPNAVLHFFARRPAGASWPRTTLAAAPGPGSAQSLLAQGVPTSQVVAPPADAASFDSESLWTVLAARDWHGRSVLVVRGEAGRDWLADRLTAAGAAPAYLAAYARRAPAFDADAQALLEAASEAPGGHLWLFSSSEAVRHLAAAWRVPPGARALASHPRIAEAARQAGFAEVGDLPTPMAEAVRVVAALAGRGAAGGAGRSIQSGLS